MKYFELEPAENTFSILAADLTHRCNMACANCYVPNREIADMELARFTDFLAKLPKPVVLRLIGGEATLYPRLNEAVKIARRFGHKVVLFTNGLKLADPAYARDLHEHGLRRVYVSMNGADDDEIYLRTDNLRCASKKLAALKNCVDLGMSVGIGAILMKGISAGVPARILEIAKALGVPAILTFRNVGQLGRYALEESENFSFAEMTEIVCAAAGLNPEFARASHSRSENQIFFRLPQSGNIWVKITNWNCGETGYPDPDDFRRGRITSDFKVAPFFAHVKRNEFHY